MRNHNDLLNMNERSLEQQAAVRRATFSPGEIKALRPFSIWEISQFMFDVPADTLRKLASDGGRFTDLDLGGLKTGKGA